MKSPNKQAPARLIPPKLVCRDCPKLVERASDTGAVDVNWNDAPEEDRVVPTDKDSIIDLCANALDTESQTVASVDSATFAPVGENEDDVVSDSPARAGSRGADDEDDNVVTTEGATVEEGEAPLSSDSEDVRFEDGPEVDSTVVLPSGKEYAAPSSLGGNRCVAW